MILSRSEMWYDNEPASGGRRLDFTVPGWADLWYHLHWFAWLSSDNDGGVTPSSGSVRWLTTDNPAAEDQAWDGWDTVAQDPAQAGDDDVVCIDEVALPDGVEIRPGTFIVENRPLPDPAMTNGNVHLRIRKWNKIVFGGGFGDAKVSAYINNARQIPLPGPMVQEFPSADNSKKPWPGKPDDAYPAPGGDGQPADDDAAAYPAPGGDGQPADDDAAADDDPGEENP